MTCVLRAVCVFSLAIAVLQGVPRPAAGQGDACDALFASTRQELEKRFSGPEDPGLLARRARLRELFGGATPSCARRLHDTLGTSSTDDELSVLFHGKLATATRSELVSLLAARMASAAAGPHVRRSIESLSSAQLDALKKGIQAMKARPDSDPTSWTYQANMHATSTTPALEAWNSCQHGNYFFLSWHRMYLYYFERILRAASGDPDLALPYWNYSDASQRALPLPFRDPADATNPLYVANRQVNGGQLAPESATEFDRALGIILFTATNSVPPRSSFGGRYVSAPRHFSDGGGELENQPHNVMHVVIGGTGGWMSDPRLAARDPIFWLHHANIDRLWKRWLAEGGGRADPDSDTNWTDTSFRFFDESGAAVDITGAGILDTVGQLDYRYDDDPVTGRAAPPKPAARAARAVDEGVGQRVAQSESVELSGRTERVALPLGSESDESLSAALAREAALLLNAEGIDYDENPGVYYELYLNLPESETAGHRSAHYVGNLAVFAEKGHADHDAEAEASEATLSFEITRSFAELRAAGSWDAEEVFVTFVPRAVVDPETGQDVLPETVPTLRIRRLSISIQEPEAKEPESMPLVRSDGRRDV